MDQLKASFLARKDFCVLLEALHQRGYHCIGPKERDGTIVFDELKTVDTLPKGAYDIQAPGQYQIEHKSTSDNFSYTTGPSALKPLLFTSSETLWQAKREADGSISFTDQHSEAVPLAVIGVHACDIAALKLQDAHFLDSEYPDRFYHLRRENLFLVAVNCSRSADTCFCVSTGDGPQVQDGYDLALTELDDGFVVRAGSDSGEAIANNLPATKITVLHLDQEKQRLTKAEEQQRSLPSHNLREFLFSNLDHPRWDNIAERCLSCGNCTSVCPTCFCYKEDEQPALEGSSSIHYREWDSCFTQGHSYIHGKTVRADTKTRYRQWLTHKLGSWHDQYGRSGCVGCGRCITWCPVGIDITREVSLMSEAGE
ncbi:MAG: 4Fe-4S dicluster domain-containing protein [Gammaproteobacteria bacterium]